MSTFKFILINLFILNSFCLNGQNFKDSIIGTWELEKEITSKKIKPELVRPPKGAGSQADIKRELIMTFQDDNKVSTKEYGEQHKEYYLISGSELRIGSTKYKILKITKTEMQFEEIDFFLPSILCFKKLTNKNIIVKDNENCTEKYSNGQKKIEGKKVNGYKSGVWVEWFESGKINKVTYYNYDVPYMAVEFDENGTVKSRRYYDMKSTKFIEEKNIEI